MRIKLGGDEAGRADHGADLGEEVALGVVITLGNHGSVHAQDHAVCAQRQGAAAASQGVGVAELGEQGEQGRARTDGARGEGGLELPQDLVPQPFERVHRDDPSGLRPRRCALDQSEALLSSAAPKDNHGSGAESGRLRVLAWRGVEGVLKTGAVDGDGGEGVNLRPKRRGEDAGNHGYRRLRNGAG